jgi:actin related protein 2/3 complex subunit 1A/1B
MKARVFSAYIKGVDQKWVLFSWKLPILNLEHIRASNPVWGDKLPFGQLCGEFGLPNGGWVHSVAFSPSGDVLAWTGILIEWFLTLQYCFNLVCFWLGHDGNVSFAYGPTSPVYTASTTGLPLLSVVFTSESAVVAGGHECVPYVFRRGGNQWELAAKLDKGKEKVETGSSAMNKFRQLDSRSQAASGDTELNSTHQNSITWVSV